MCNIVWKNEKFTLTQKFSRQISYLVILLVKSLLSRNFCQKRVRVNFRNFHTVIHGLSILKILDLSFSMGIWEFAYFTHLLKQQSLLTICPIVGVLELGQEWYHLSEDASR